MLIDPSGRNGGDEIIVLMTGTEIIYCQLTADRLHGSVAESPLTLRDGRTLIIQLSAGITWWQPGKALNHLIRIADQAARDGAATASRCAHCPPIWPLLGAACKRGFITTRFGTQPALTSNYTPN